MDTRQWMRAGAMVVLGALMVAGCGRSFSAGTDAGPNAMADGAPLPLDLGGTEVMSVTIEPSAVSVVAGAQANLRAIAELSDGSTLDVTDSSFWSSDDEAIATVVAGRVTGVGAGTVVVRVTIESATAEAEVEVTAEARLTGLEVAPAVASALPGGRVVFVATATFSDGSSEDVTELAEWGTEDEGVAAVDAGVVDALAPGVTIVRATFAERAAEAQLEVLAARVESIAVRPSAATVGIGGVVAFTAEASLDDGSVLDVTESADWTVESPAIGGVLEPGVIEGLAPGDATVRASFDGFDGTAVLTVTPARLQRVEVSPVDPTVGPGVEIGFRATGVFDDGTTADLTATATWVSSDPAVFAIDPGGLGTSVAPGTAIVTATSGGLDGSSTVTVTEARLLALEAEPSSLTVGPTETGRLTVIGLYDDGSEVDLTASALWSSDDAAVANVSNAAGSEGLVTGLAPGETVVRASFDGLEATVAIVVTEATLIELSVAPLSLVLPVGGDAELTATGTFSDGSIRDVTGTVTWTSAAPLVATVSSVGDTAGRVTALAEGTATITATLDGVNASATVEVTAAALVSITVAPVDATTTAGLRTAYSATGEFGDGSTADLTALATWSTADADVATVENLAGAEGQLLAVGAGSTTVTAAFDGVEGSTTVTVEGPEITEIQVTPVAPDVVLGNPQQFTAFAIFSDGSRQNVTGRASWTSSSTTVATLNMFGQATTLAAGTTTITATFQGQSGTATLTVRAATITEIQVTPIAPTLTVGGQVRFQATAIYSDGTSQNVSGQATFTSSDTAILGIGNAGFQRGLATAVAAGTATVTATFDGVSGTQTVTVSPAVVVEVSVTPITWSGAVGEDQQFQAVAIFSDGTSQNVTGAATWTSSDAAVAQVSNAGFGGRGSVEALAAGDADITATYEGVSGTAEVTVTSATVTTVQVTPFLPSVAAGSTQRFQAVAIFSDGTSRNVSFDATWTSSDTAVAAVSNTGGQSGVSTSLAAGSTVITAQYLGVSGSTTLTVTAAVIDRIQVTPLAPSRPLGFGIGMVATAIYTDSTTETVTGQATWSSSSTATATVSNAFGSRGQVTTVAAGTTSISAQFMGVTGSTTLTVTNATLTSIAVTPATATIDVAERLDFTATGTFSDASTLDLTNAVTWSSSDLAVADVSNGAGSQGEGVGFSAGTVTVTARRGGISGTASLTVR